MKNAFFQSAYKVSFLMFFTIVYVQKANAFPELTRYQYNNCVSCHLAPSGGSLLTTYGRDLSFEVLSSTGDTNEAKILHGTVDTKKFEDWLLIGGDIRAVQTHREDENIRKGNFYKMQADIALALYQEKWALALTFGEISADESKEWKPYGTQYYFMYKPTENIGFRVGRFLPQYGIFLSDHFAYVKQFHKFGLKGSNLATRDNFEAQWANSEWIITATASTEDTKDDPEKAGTIQAQYFFAERFKVAANYWKGGNSSYIRDIIGAWGILGFTQKIFLLTEMNWQRKNETSTPTVNSFTSYNKLGYTITKGLDLFLQHEIQEDDISDPSTRLTRMGPGVQFYPRPHFEILGAWTKVQKPNTKEADYAWLLLHYYL